MWNYTVKQFLDQLISVKSNDSWDYVGDPNVLSLLPPAPTSSYHQPGNSFAIRIPMLPITSNNIEWKAQ